MYETLLTLIGMLLSIRFVFIFAFLSKIRHFSEWRDLDIEYNKMISKYRIYIQIILRLIDVIPITIWILCSVIFEIFEIFKSIKDGIVSLYKYLVYKEK